MLKSFFRYIHIKYRHRMSPLWACWTWQQYCGRPHEVDIHLLARLEGMQGMVLDLGANAAVFANSLFMINNTLKVQSWEPNKSLRRYLIATLLLHPRRFRYRLLAAGEHNHQVDLHIPVTLSADLSPSASLDPAEFEKDYVKKRLENVTGKPQSVDFKRQRVRVQAVDDARLHPDVIKIDVEGWELEALLGLRQTLQRCHPLLMIEKNNIDRWLGFLRDLGYILYSYNHERTRLNVIGERCPTLNVIGLHPDSPAEIRQRLAGLID